MTKPSTMHRPMDHSVVDEILGDTTPRPGGPDAGYRSIASYGLIGNTHSAALVGRDGSIDWCCLPHFDSPAVFCRILDAEHGGFLQLTPIGAWTSTRRYVGETAVLETTFHCAQGVVRITDLMHSRQLTEPGLYADGPASHRILRLVEGISGRVELDVIMRATPDYARRCPSPSLAPGVAIVRDVTGTFALEVAGADLRADASGTVATRLSVGKDERRWVVLSYGERDDATVLRMIDDPDAVLAEALRDWTAWSARATYDGPYRQLVVASARVLKLLTFGPTGAIVAAPTTSLPESIGGVRNWDYRFTWLRDSALILLALQGLGYHDAAIAFFEWLSRVCTCCRDLQIMYTIAGQPDLPELELSHLDGHRGSRPVRIGNAAADQRQLDVYGHVLDAALICHERLHPISDELGDVLRQMADHAATRWREPDHGMWEVRGAPRHFVSSKLMCWTALDRALRMAEGAGLHGDVARWRTERDAIRAAITDGGFDADLGAFTQALGGAPALDASVLLMPLVGFLPATDPRMRSTVEQIRERLTSNGLVYRYLNEDGVVGSEATFAICTFWLVDNLTLQGRLGEARSLFEHVTSFANDLGLLAEEIDPTNGELLGNFPQGFTHLALIRSALLLAAAP